MVGGACGAEFMNPKLFLAGLMAGAALGILFKPAKKTPPLWATDPDYAPPAFGADVFHPYSEFENLGCCGRCGAGSKHAIHSDPDFRAGRQTFDMPIAYFENPEGAPYMGVPPSENRKSHLWPNLPWPNLPGAAATNLFPDRA